MDCSENELRDIQLSNKTKFNQIITQILKCFHKERLIRCKRKDNPFENQFIIEKINF